MRSTAVLLLLSSCAGPSGTEVEAARSRARGLLPEPKEVTEGEGAWRLSVDQHVQRTVDESQPREGYELRITRSGIELRSSTAAGAFYGEQTLNQLLEPNERSGVLTALTIKDEPRYEWRGLMLDVARHFFEPEELKRLIDVAAAYKLNRFHVHLTDDQGWRLSVERRPKLTEIGGSTQVGGAAGGHYTRAELQELVSYAAARHIELIPEVDLPGHCTAALASYAELNCDSISRPLYTGTQVGISTVCTTRPETDQFVADVLDELAAIVPNGFVHLGGDEAAMTPRAEYAAFMERYLAAARSRGLKPIGWEEAAKAQATPPPLLQIWLGNATQADLASGAQVILSPAKHLYLDMKYTSETEPGTFWAGFVEVQAAYGWDPDDYGYASVAGIEAALWTEFVTTDAEVELMMFPRALAAAELGWSPKSKHQWASFRRRLGQHGERLEARGLNYYRSPQIDWEP